MNIKPGTIGLVKMRGDAGRLIRAGQWLNGDGFADFEHAFAYLGGGKIIEAEPGGAVIRDAVLGYDIRSIWWCTGIAALLPPGAGVAAAAGQLAGVPYSWADYAALAAHRLHVPAPGLRDYIASTGHMICSQLCDELYLRLGAQIFDDGRWPGFVTPGALYQRDLELRGRP